MSTAVTITDIIARTILWLALIGSGLKLALTVAPRFQIAAPKAPVQPKDDAKAKADDTTVTPPALVPGMENAA